MTDPTVPTTTKCGRDLRNHYFPGLCCGDEFKPPMERAIRAAQCDWCRDSLGQQYQSALYINHECTGTESYVLAWNLSIAALLELARKQGVQRGFDIAVEETYAYNKGNFGDVEDIQIAWDDAEKAIAEEMKK